MNKENICKNSLPKCKAFCCRAIASYAWSNPGDYNIRVRIKDIYGHINISDPWRIHIYRGSILHITPGKISGGIGKISALIENVGDKEAINVQWNISVEGGIHGGINITSGGRIDELKADVSRRIFTDKFIFGGIKIIVTASAEGVKEVTQLIIGLVFFLFIYTHPMT